MRLQPGRRQQLPGEIQLMVEAHAQLDLLVDQLLQRREAIAGLGCQLNRFR
ncbi:hypothetical protein D3C72_2481700 [compost metagenome]